MIRSLEVQAMLISIFIKHINGTAFIPANQIQICLFWHQIVKLRISG